MRVLPRPKSPVAGQSPGASLGVAALPAGLMSSPRILRRLSRHRAFRVMVLGTPSVGKTAMVVRFLTKRFIGDYANIEKKYTHQLNVEGEQVMFEVLDTILQEDDMSHMEEKIRWADAFIMVYSVTDRCSFEECTRLRFIINHVKKTRKMSTYSSQAQQDIPVILVGNKNDLEYDRMVSPEEGLKKSQDLGCVAFHDTSARESLDDVKDVFLGAYKLWRHGKTSSKAVSPNKESRLSVEEHSFDGNNNDDKDEGLKRKTSFSRRLINKVMPNGKSSSKEDNADDQGLTS